MHKTQRVLVVIVIGREVCFDIYHAFALTLVFQLFNVSVKQACESTQKHNEWYKQWIVKLQLEMSLHNIRESNGMEICIDYN